jgi:molybdopterin/thiamine biosynthesis adenylyltransferase/rhodanese-related sulfurtransferase
MKCANDGLESHDGHDGHDHRAPQGAVRDVPPEDFTADVVVDVRTHEEREGGFIAGSLHLPGDQLDALDLPRHTVVGLYCAGGTRSRRAAETLAARGFEVVLNLEGGLRAWVASGRPIAGGALTPAQEARYARQTVMTEVGRAGQGRLLSARVLIVGAGGLGSPVSMYLAAAGIGTLGLVDDDRVELSNLQRQVLYDTEAVGRPKVEVAADRLARMNPDARVVGHALRLTGDNAHELLAAYDVVCDCSDNFATRYAINDAAVALGKPVVHGAVHHFDGEVAVFGVGGPCYRCLHPKAPQAGLAPSCAEAGVIGAVCGLVGSLQAMEVVKLVVGVGQTLGGSLLSVDARSGTFMTTRLARDPDCPTCGPTPVHPGHNLSP